MLQNQNINKLAKTIGITNIISMDTTHEEKTLIVIMHMIYHKAAERTFGKFIEIYAAMHTTNEAI